MTAQTHAALASPGHDDLRGMLYDISDLTSRRNPRRDQFKRQLARLIERAKQTK